MRLIQPEPWRLSNGLEICSRKDAGHKAGPACRISAEEDLTYLSIPASGGSICLDELKSEHGPYVSFEALNCDPNSMILLLNVYVSGEVNPAFFIRLGLLPALKARLCLDLNWLDGRVLFAEPTPGSLKIVCHGRPVERSEITRVELAFPARAASAVLGLGSILCSEAAPADYPLPRQVLVDRFGQNACRDWPQKVRSERQLQQRLNELLEQTANPTDMTAGAEPLPRLDRWGGSLALPLTAPGQYFRTVKKAGRWWLADPDGYAFFSVGPDCAGLATDCRVDGLAPLLEWLPDPADPQYKTMFKSGSPLGSAERCQRQPLMFSYLQANLQRAWGSTWYSRWQQLLCGSLKQNGLNTLGNWSDPALCALGELPYVTTLPTFPTTSHCIFRDFPDVFSPEFEQAAAQAAASLRPYRGDPALIGYFLRNEPAWAFVDHLSIAEVLLQDEEPSFSKAALIDYLRERYLTPADLAAAWQLPLADFSDLLRPRDHAGRCSDQAARDLSAFSRIMIERYVRIPSQACRREDPDHLNLGLRWAWISDPDLVCGWEHFDVFSVNCYAETPVAILKQIRQLNVDLPVMIGEFHFGALDAGPTATGLEAVRTQQDRALAYQIYCEAAAAQPNCIGCHYFQCYDQFTLGRFDGENYNIGLYDICSQPYAAMARATRKVAARMYPLMAGQLSPFTAAVDRVPMIAY
ncbi:MAG: hypothetical protein PHP39_07465 [Oscillospiraceae bacterium]|nr:hypothetical protein [Oscillospiraceae bacterium]